MSRYYLTEPVNSKLVVPSIRGFRNSISIEDQRVSRVEPMASSGIYSVGKQAQRHGFGFEIRFHSTRSNQNGRVMAGVHVLEFTIRGQNAKENGRIALHFRMLADEAVGMLKNGWKFRPQGNRGEGPLQHRSHQCSAKTLPADVCDDKSRSLRTQLDQVKVIAPHRQAGTVDAGDLEVSEFLEILGQQGLLDSAGNRKLLFHSLAFLLPIPRTPNRLTNAPASLEERKCIPAPPGLSPCRRIPPAGNLPQAVPP